MIAARQIFLGRGGAKLPYDAEVEYLESTGTQWIDTGFVASNKTKMTGDVQFTVLNYGNDAQIFGMSLSQSDASSRLGFGMQVQSTGGNVYFGMGNKNLLGTNLQRDTNRHVWFCDLESGTYGRDSNVYSSLFTWNNSGNGSPLIFARRLLAHVDCFCCARCWSFAIYDNGVLVRDFIPVRFTNELDQSEGAMYDRVSGELEPFRNQGTGAFGYGNDK